MSSENLVILMGNLGADPDLRYTQNNTPVCNISLATNERYQTREGDTREVTEWHRLVIWGKMAEIAKRYLIKGNRAFFKGKLQTRKWTDRDGVERYITEIKVNDLRLLDYLPSGDTAADQNIGKQKASTTIGHEAEDSGLDDDLPF